MSLLSIPIFAFTALTLLAICRLIIFPAFLSPLSKIPNAHWSSSISPLWSLWIKYKVRENRTVHAAHLKHGSVVRLGPNELSVNDVVGMRTVYAGGFEKGEWYSIFDNYGVPCMFSSWYSRHHSTRKRMISNTYSKSYLHSSEALEQQSRVILYDRLLPVLNSVASAVQGGPGIDVHDFWFASTMDFITCYMFGLKNGSDFIQNEGYRRHWLALYHGRKTYTFFSQELPRLHRFLNFFHVHLVPTWVDDANKELEQWTQDRCDATTAYLKNMAATDSDPGNEPVVLSTLLAGIEKESKLKGEASILSDTALKYPRLSIASEMIDQLAAGHETSGITLTYLSWRLSQNIPLQDKLRTELLTLSSNLLLCDSNKLNIPDPKELDSLPLLHAVLMETLRLHAAIPGAQPRVTPSPSCTLGKFSDIPGGVRVEASGYSLHRNAEVYPEPEKWDYTRWLDSENGYTEEQRKDRDRWFWAFSSGGRMCVGSNFAMHEIKLVIAAVYTNFRTHIVDDDGIEQEDGYTCGPTSNKLILRFEKVE